MTATLLAAAASAQTTELQLGTTLALSSGQRSSALACSTPSLLCTLCTVLSLQVSSHLNCALQLALQQILGTGSQFWAQQPAGAQAGAEATAVWPGCT